MVVAKGGWIGVYHDITNLFWGNCLVGMSRVYPTILFSSKLYLDLGSVVLHNVRSCCSTCAVFISALRNIKQS